MSRLGFLKVPSGSQHHAWDLPGCLWPVRCILLSWALKEVRERTAHVSIKHSIHLKTSNIKLLTEVSLLSPEDSLFYKLHYYSAIKRFNDLSSTLDLSQMLPLSTKYQTYSLRTQTWEILSESLKADTTQFSILILARNSSGNIQDFHNIEK